MNPELESISGNFAETIANIAPKPVTVASGVNRGNLIAVPKDYVLKNDAELEQLQDFPTRKKGALTFVTIESFAAYVNLHKTPETRLYAKVDQTSSEPLKVTAVFNEHKPHATEGSTAGWRDFRAVFLPASSFEWKVWTSKDRQPFSQFDFAVYLEDNIKDIHKPDPDVNQPGQWPTGTQMLEMAKDLEINAEKSFKSSVRMQSGGVELAFVDKDDSATAERMSAFNQFAIGIPVFWKDSGYSITARLRYRQKSNALVLWYELVRPDLTIDDAVSHLLDKVKEKTSIDPMFVHANGQI